MAAASRFVHFIATDGTGVPTRLMLSGGALLVIPSGTVRIREADGRYVSDFAKLGPSPDICVPEIRRISLLVCNTDHSGIIYLRWGDGHIDPANDLQLLPGEKIFFDHPSRDILYAMTDGGSFNMPYILCIEP